MLRAFVLALLCYLSLTPLMARPWVSHQSTFATINTRLGEEPLAKSLLPVVDRESLRVANAIGLDSIKRFPIFFYTSHAEFMRDAGLNPELLGVSYSPSGLIRVDATNMRGSVETILAHEITHTLLYQRLGIHAGELPTWVNEGIAGYLSEPISRDMLPYYAHRQHARGMQSIEQMEQAFAGRQSTDAAYLQSASMIAWLEYRYPGSLQNILSRMDMGDSFYQALGDVTELTPEGWLARWKSGIPEFEMWLSLAGSPVVFAPMAILVIIVVLLRGRKHDDEEEEEEDEEPAPTAPHTYPHVSPVPPSLAQYPILDDLYTP